MRFVRVVVVLIISYLVLSSGAPSAEAEDACALAVLCREPQPQPQPQPHPQPQPQPQPQPEPAPSPQPAPTRDPDPAPAGDEPASARELSHLLDRSRADHGLPPLRLDRAAEAVAFEHSRQMAARRDIWHNEELFTPATKKRLDARSVGENVALNSTATGAHDRLMSSEGHRANILNAAFTAGAVGAVRGEDGRLYVTEVFIEPFAPAPAQQAAPAPAPAPAPKVRTGTVIPAKPLVPAIHAGATTTSVLAPAPPAAEDGTGVAIDADAGAVPDRQFGPRVPDDAVSEFAAGRQLPRPAASDGFSLHGPGVLAALALLGVGVSTAAAIRRRAGEAEGVPDSWRGGTDSPL